MTQMFRRLLQLLIIRPFVLGFLGLNLRHRERLPRSGPAVVVANHNSHLDTLVLMTLFPVGFPARLRPVAASDYFLRNRWLAWLAVNMIGIIPLRRGRFDRHDGDPLDGCSQALKGGEILILFPEGTRGEPDQLSTFKSGIVYLAKRHPDVPIVPVFLHGPGKSLPKGKVVPVPFLCDVLVGTTLRWNGDRRHFMQCLQEQMTNLAHEGAFPVWA